jgi:hypothetical protein
MCELLAKSDNSSKLSAKSAFAWSVSRNWPGCKATVTQSLKRMKKWSSKVSNLPVWLNYKGVQKNSLPPIFQFLATSCSWQLPTVLSVDSF